jgi:RNA polymerase sigma factor (sigma-70 family)
MHNDELLIKKAQGGDAKAFETLLSLYYDHLYTFAYKWCANREDAEDIAQQACIKLARGLDQFRFESQFTTWLYRLVLDKAATDRLNVQIKNFMGFPKNSHNLLE